MTWHEQIQELISLTQLHLLRDYSPQDRLACEPESFQFYKTFALSQRQPKLQQPVTPPLPAPVVEQPPRPVKKEEPPLPPAAPPTPLAPAKATVPTPPEPKKEVILPQAPGKTTFELQPLTSASPKDTDAVREIISQQIPGLAFVNDIPSDGEAKKHSQRWQHKVSHAEIALVFDETSDKGRRFTSDIALALRFRFGAVVCLSSQQFASDYQTLLNSTELRLLASPKNYLMTTGQTLPAAPHQSVKAGSASLFILDAVEEYCRNPLRKQQLWQALCQELGI